MSDASHAPAGALAAPAPEAAAFWDRHFAGRVADGEGEIALPADDVPVVRDALAYFGDLRGRTLLDLGCGRGAASLAFAKAGAHVVSVDASPVAVEALGRHCRARGIANVVPLCASAAEVHDLPQALVGPGGRPLGPVDCVFGSMILHHIEPLAPFVADLRAVLRPGGRGFFYENNARSRVLVWFRDHVVGRGWVPKFGDPDEFPLTPDEVELLRRHFAVDVSYPRLKFFELVSQYLLRGRGKSLLVGLDRWAYRAAPALRPYSYVQYLRLS